MHALRLAVAAVLFGALNASAATIGFGSLTDALEGSVADLAAASITVDDGGTVTFLVEFGPTTVFGAARAGFNLDTDQNIATGFPGITNGGADAEFIGGEYLLVFRSTDFQGDAQLIAYGGGTFPTVGTFAVVFDALALTMSTTVSLADLGGDDGQMNFKLTSQQQLTEFSSTGIQDFMSDLGQPGASVVVVPEPSTWATLGLGLLGLIGLARRTGRGLTART